MIRSFSSIQTCWSCTPRRTAPGYNLVQGQGQGQGLLVTVPGLSALSSWLLILNTCSKEHAFSPSTLPELGDLQMPPKPLAVIT